MGINLDWIMFRQASNFRFFLLIRSNISVLWIVDLFSICFRQHVEFCANFGMVVGITLPHFQVVLDVVYKLFLKFLA